MKLQKKTHTHTINTPQHTNSNEASTYCAMKAWEIEQAMFNLLKNKLNESLISPEYRDKIRTLKRSLEDQRNSTLCLRVLAGQIAATDFINIPNEQLASRRIKLEFYGFPC